MEWAKKSDKVSVTGRVPHDEIPRCMAAMDCLVHPTYREGFGMVLQEAMAMAVPIITTNIPGPSEVIEDEKSGVLITPQSEDSLYQALTDAISNKERFAQMGINGRARVENCFARPVMMERILEDKEELYKNYCSKK